MFDIYETIVFNKLKEILRENKRALVNITLVILCEEDGHAVEYCTYEDFCNVLKESATERGVEDITLKEALPIVFMGRDFLIRASILDGKLTMTFISIPVVEVESKKIDDARIVENFKLLVSTEYMSEAIKRTRLNMNSLN